MNYCKQCNELLSDDAAFCSKCGCKVEEIYIQHQTEKDITIPRKKTNVCSILAIIFGSIGVIPLLNIIFVPIAVILGIIGIIIGRSKGPKIASIIVLIISIVTSLLWMLPAITSTSITSSNNNNSVTQNPSTICSHSYNLIESEATCSSGGYVTYQCSLCNETKRGYKNASGHSWSNNKCESCGATKDLELDPQNNDILTIDQINIDINSVGGVETDITYTNHTDKQIAYIYFTIKYYDRMGYAAYCEIQDTSVQRLRVTGPIDAGETDTSYWKPVIYNSATAVSQPQKIEIVFADETRQTIICTGRYWYTGSYYGGDLHE